MHEHLVGAADGEKWVLGLVVDRVPGGHDLVADVFVESAVPLEDDLGQVAQVLVEDFEHVFGGHRLGHRGEAADVDEQE